MKSLRLDFLHPQPRPHWGGWVLLAVGVGMAAWAGWQGSQVQRALDEAVAAAPPPAAVSRRAVGVTAGSGQNAARQDSEQLTAPWSDLFARLETNRPKRIALVGLEADARKTEATLTAEARTAKDMLDYVEQLKSDAGFVSVTLASHAVQESDPQLPLRFVLRLVWRS